MAQMLNGMPPCREQRSACVSFISSLQNDGISKNELYIKATILYNYRMRIRPFTISS